jgi:hypothetical protein
MTCAPSNEMTVNVDPVFLMYAFRYALGRRSYAVSDVARALIEHRGALRPQWQAQIVERISEAIDEGAAGDESDVEQWRRVSAALGG